MARFAYLAIVIACAAYPSAGRAHKAVAFDRRHTAASEGVISNQYRIRVALDGKPEVTRSYEFKSIKVRFRLRLSSSGPWNLLLGSQSSALDQQIVSGTGNAEMWSDKLPAAGDIVLSGEQIGRTVLVIDRIALIAKGSSPQALTVNKLEPFTNHPELADVGAGVAKLSTLSRDGDIEVCTAFLVRSDLVVTNYHCIHNKMEMTSALIEFGYDDELAVPKQMHLGRRVVGAKRLDLAVYQLAEESHLPGLTLSSDEVFSNENLVLIEHPDGGPKMISLSECHVTAVSAAQYNRDVDFQHRCDSRGGSSGSPALDFFSHKVVGLHHLGFDGDPHTSVNLAVKMSSAKKCIDSATLTTGHLERKGEIWAHVQNCRAK